MGSDPLLKKYEELALKQLNGTITPEEARELSDWLNTDDGVPLEIYGQQLSKAEYGQQLWERISPQEVDLPIARGRIYRWPRIAVAASVLVMLAAGAYLWLKGDHEQADIISEGQHQVKILPGKEGAILTLANGSQVVLDSLQSGWAATQTGAQVQLRNGQLAYTPTGETAGAPAYNTIATPKGRQFVVTLPDGSRVWLNAASSLRYPTLFSGSERKVELKGEAYFEVAKKAAMPFRVNVNRKATIEVLGTQFNVNAYDNEPSIRTTLVDGSIRTAAGSSYANGVTVKPGQQARILNTTGRQTAPGIKLVQVPDMDKVTAWKNGLFNFEGASLQEVMQQLERWYDIEVVYEKGIPIIEFGGKITRGVSFSGLLVLLERAGVHFRLEGRKLIVLP